MTSILGRLFGRGKEESSAQAAKRRLQFVLVHDRINLPPDIMTAMKEEILQVISKYVQSFVPTAHGLRTDDDAVLREVTDVFGVTFMVTTGDSGDVEVSHSGAMYVVDETGKLVLTWPFGVTADDVAADLEVIRGEIAAGADAGAGRRPAPDACAVSAPSRCSPRSRGHRPPARRGAVTI